MKLAEALQERADINRNIEQLKKRLNNNVLVQEGEQTADFIPCVVFGKQAEFAEKYFRKGTKVVISGRITTGSYTNKDGQKIYTTEITVEEQEFAESKGSSEAQGTGQMPTPNGDGFMSVPDDDTGLPFN